MMDQLFWQGRIQCENQHEREDRFLDIYEADPDNNGKLQSFISSFKNTEPCQLNILI